MTDDLVKRPDDEQDDLTLVYMWAYKMAEKKYKSRIEQLELALKFYECGCKQDSCTPEEPKFRSIKCGWIAKAALGEKTDG